MRKNYKGFFELVKDYYSDLDEVCAVLDKRNDDGEEPIPGIDEEQLRLSLHFILDAIDSIDDPAFWEFVKNCIGNKKVKK